MKEPLEMQETESIVYDPDDLKGYDLMAGWVKTSTGYWVHVCDGVSCLGRLHFDDEGFVVQ